MKVPYPEYRPLSETPIDEWVILATTGEWVGQAIYGEDEENPTWRWATGGVISPNLKPLGWLPLPPSIRKEVESKQ